MTTENYTMAETFEFDVFLSHSSKDKPAVRELAERLKADGLRVWFDEWEIAPGDMIGLKIEKGLEQSRVLVLVMSKNAFASEWTALERHTVMFRDPTNQHRRFIPLLLEDADIPDMLRQFLYVDWRRRAEAQYISLLTACRSSQGEKGSNSAIYKTKGLPSTSLAGHTAPIYGVAITSDGKRAVSGSADMTLRVWDLDARKCLRVLTGHTATIRDVAVSKDGQIAISASDDMTIRVWDLDTYMCIATLKGHSDAVYGVAISTDKRRIVSGSKDESMRIWDLELKLCIAVHEGPWGWVNVVAFAMNDQKVVMGTEEGLLVEWDVSYKPYISASKIGHNSWIWGIAIAGDGSRVISGSGDWTVRVWDLSAESCIFTLEGHMNRVSRVALTLNGKIAISASLDTTARVWDLDSGQCINILRGHTEEVSSVAITPDGRRVITASHDKTLLIWELSLGSDSKDQHSEALSYTNAKVLLVGDSGVGKTGLALRLTEDRFEATDSTDGVEASQIKLTSEKDANSPNEWATQLQLPHDGGADGVEREIWLWDFAGQSDYRLIHQLYMDETALAVFVFNPQSSDPFDGLGQWDRDLQRAARRPFRKLLVAGRCDRGGLTVSREAVDRFHAEREFAGYLETSAKTGNRCQELREAIIGNIDWKGIPWTSSPRIFKVLKDEIVKLKDSGIALLRMGELKQQLEMRLPGEVFTVEELRAVAGLLAGPGVVWKLEFGDFVLLQPERINAYAAAAIRKVRAHTDELGYIFEEDILAGDLNFADMRRLPPDDEAIVLRAMNQTFVERGLCLREHTDRGPLLVFPSYFRRERPDLGDDHPAVCVTYRFSGPLDEIYATLVVRLHHTPAFEKDQIWRFAADFTTLGGKRAGLKMIKKPEGAAEIVVYFGPDVVEDTRALFIGYIHDHLQAKAQDVVRERDYVCPYCGTAVANRAAVRVRLERGLKDIICVGCEKRVLLWDVIEEKFAAPEFRQQLRDMERAALASIDNESRELILVGHAFSIAGEAGQIFRPTPNSDWGIDGEIEFKDDRGQASGQRVYLQLKSGDSYLYTRKGDDKEIFAIKNPRHAEYWQAHAYPVMLVIRASSGQIRWMNVTEYLKKAGTKTKQIEFAGEPFTALNLVRMRDKVMAG